MKLKVLNQLSMKNKEMYFGCIKHMYCKINFQSLSVNCNDINDKYIEACKRVKKVIKDMIVDKDYMLIEKSVSGFTYNKYEERHDFDNCLEPFLHNMIWQFPSNITPFMYISKYFKSHQTHWVRKSKYQIMYKDFFYKIVINCSFGIPTKSYYNLKKHLEK